MTVHFGSEQQQAAEAAAERATLPLTIFHHKGTFYCEGHCGDLSEVADKLRQIHHGATPVEIQDIDGRVLVAAHEPIPERIPGTPRPLNEAFQSKRKDLKPQRRSRADSEHTVKRNWGLGLIIIATLLALGFAVWVVEDQPGETFVPGFSGTHQTYGPMKGNERKALPGPTTPQRLGGDNEIRKMEQARQELERLPKGKIVLDAPKAMKVGDIRAVYANVGINVPIELLRRHSRPTDQSHEAFLSVSREMGATLTGPGFSITPTTHEQQGVAEGFPTVWSWNVEAKQEGEQELEATLYVLLPVGDKSTRQRIDSYTHKIGVSIKEQSWAEWLKSSKEEVEAVHVIAITLGSAVMAVLGWLGLSYSRRRQIENRNQTEAT
jgi:hypothetical protein